MDYRVGCVKSLDNIFLVCYVLTMRRKPTHRDVIKLFPTHQALADLLGVKRNTVSMMYLADRIEAKYCCMICEAKPEVDIRELAEHVRVRMK